MKRHSVVIENGSGLDERRIDGRERLLLRKGRELRSFKVSELVYFKVHPAFNDEHVVLEMCDARGGTWEQLPRGARIELGDESWAAGDLISFHLQKDPEPVEVTRPYAEGTWLVHHVSGATTHLEGVVRFESLSEYVWSDGGLAVPPPEKVTS